MVEKKASEIVIELQEQVKHLTRLVTVQDNNIKLILQKLNQLSLSPLALANPVKSGFAKPQIITNVPNINPKTNELATPDHSSKNLVLPNTKPKLDTTDLIGMKAAHAEQENKMSAFEKMKAEAGIVDSPHDIAEAKVNTNASVRRTQRVKSNEVTNISVSQQLLDSSGVPLQLANVSISDDFGNVIINTRSNTKGRWVAPLPPGQYNVHVLKRFISEKNKSPLESRYDITVIDSASGKVDFPEVYIES